jgi:hypothetical protein
MKDRSAEDLSRDPNQPDALPDFLDEPVKTNDPKELRKKQIDDKAKELKQEADLREVLSTQGGVRFVARILDELCYIDATPFNPNNSTMCNIAGRRQIAMEIKRMVRDADFELWVKVDRELESRRPKPRTSNPRR